MSAFRYFAIFGTMRTGSNLLERTLDSYEGLVGLGELFNPHFIGGPEATEAFGATMTERNADPLGFLEQAIAAHDGLTPGFRIFEDHDRRVADFAARDPSCAKIVLTRDPLDSWLSLEIARKTGQWMIRKAENRRLEKVEFNADAFEAYRDRIGAHYRRLRQSMCAASQPWIEVAYDDLGDLDTLNGIAGFVGSLERKETFEPRIQRQNPPRAADKVTNPRALAAWMKDGGGVLAQAPTLAPRFSALDAMFVSRGVEVVCAPIPGVADAALRTFLERAQQAAGKSDKPLSDKLKGKQVERRRARGTFVFSLIRHPADRIREVFVRFAKGTAAPDWLRETLIARYGASPGLDEDGDFDAFLAFVADNIAGRTPGDYHPEWAPQSELLAIYAEETPVDFVARAERIGEDAPYILSRLGVPDPDGEVTATLAAALKRPETPRLTPDREERICEIYARDYARLGYKPQTAG